MRGGIARCARLHSARLVPDSQLALDLLEIVDVHPRRERFAASRAPGRLALCPGFAIESDAELRRPLEDVEELAEGQVQQGEDDGDGMFTSPP